MRRAPNGSITLNSRSESSGKFNFCFTLNFACASTESALHPITAVSRAVKILHCVTKLGRFTRSTRCVGLREKVQDEIFPAIFGGRKRFPIVRRGLKFRCLVAFFEHDLGPTAATVA